MTQYGWAWSGCGPNPNPIHMPLVDPEDTCRVAKLLGPFQLLSQVQVLSHFAWALMQVRKGGKKSKYVFTETQQKS
jgi:hypothetical protein